MQHHMGPLWRKLTLFQPKLIHCFSLSAMGSSPNGIMCWWKAFVFCCFCHLVYEACCAGSWELFWFCQMPKNFPLATAFKLGVAQNSKSRTINVLFNCNRNRATWVNRLLVPWDKAHNSEEKQLKSGLWACRWRDLFAFLIELSQVGRIVEILIMPRSMSI